MSVAALFAAATLNAQTISDILRFSQYDYSMGTARSAAMGGAFTSLGADLSSMSINPAGLGMYLSSDFGVSATIAGNSMNSVYSGNSVDNGRTRFSLSNAGLALNLHQANSGLTGLTFGFTYNKVADLNTTQYFYGNTPLNSITELFAEQVGGVSQSTLNLGGYKPYDKVGTDQWGGVLAWQTGILDPATNSSGQEISDAYTPFFNLNPDSKVSNVTKIVSDGYIAEYDFAVGASIDNMLYLGMTIGFQDVKYKSTISYDESYNANSTYTLEAMMYDRYSKLVGSGINVKLGATIRPTDYLRIGIAYHSPTWLGVETTYVDYMEAKYYGYSSEGRIDTPYLLNDISIRTPSRLLVGASMVLPNIGIISADYERVWYNNVRMGNTSYSYDYYGNEYSQANYDDQISAAASEAYRPANNFRAGIELTPANNFFVRAGYAFYDSAFEYDDTIASNCSPDRTSWTNYSAGLGFRFGNSYFDITYVYSVVDYTTTDIFYGSYYDSGTEVVIESGTFNTQLKRNAVTLTLGSRF